MIRPPHAVGINGRPVGEGPHEHLGEAEAPGLLNVPVAGERQDSGCPTAVAVIVPESRADPARQAAAGYGVPASVGKRGPDASAVTWPSSRNTWASPAGPLHQP
jgi:hypothetical protein